MQTLILAKTHLTPPLVGFVSMENKCTYVTRFSKKNLNAFSFVAKGGLISESFYFGSFLQKICQISFLIIFP